MIFFLEESFLISNQKEDLGFSGEYTPHAQYPQCDQYRRYEE